MDTYRSVNGKWCIFYIAPLSKALYIHPFTHTFIHRWRRKPCKAPTCSPGATRFRVLLKDSSTLTLREPGIELGTLREPSVF